MLPRPRNFYCGLALVCMSVLMLQITETRYLSAVAYYYLAFLNISMAMFGMTVGALFVYFNQNYFSSKHLSYHLTWTTGAYAISLALCFILQTASLAVIGGNVTTVFVWLKLLVLLATPFVFAGMAVSLALTRSPFPISVVYGVDLVGAASGCLVVIVLLNTVDAQSAMFAIAAIGAGAAFCFSRAGLGAVPENPGWHWRWLRRPGWAAIAILALAIANANTNRGIRPIVVKGHFDQPSTHQFEQWNSFSRVVAGYPFMGSPPLWSASRTLEPGLKVDHVNMNIDGFAGTHMHRFEGDLKAVSYLSYDVTNLAYFVRNQGKSAVIGVGSGRDVLSAYLFGFRDITGVEINPIFIDFLQNPKRLRKYAGIADLPGVRLVVDEGRSWFARTQERFDLIQMSMIDTFAATGAGAFSLSENGLYTVEGWRVFLSALAPQGVFTVSRWHSDANPVEIGRVVSLAMTALYSLGVPDPRSNIFLASNENLATIVMGREKLTPADITGLTDAANRLQYEIVMAPGRPSSAPIFEDLGGASSRADLDARASRYPLDVSAPTDASPFFFNQLRITHPEDLLTMIRARGAGGSFTSGASLVVSGNLLAIGTLTMLIVLSAFLVVVVIVLPGRRSARIADRGLVRSGTAYFLLIGLGFMLVEVGLIQRMSLFMGHPVYGLSVVLFSIILATGIGSFLSERVAPRTKAHFAIWLGALGGYLVALPFWLPSLTFTMEAATLPVRAALCVGVIMPAGILMGFGFPTGMRLVTRRDPRPTPWFWGINGAAGVLSAGFAVLCSIAFSIDVTTRLGGLAYLLLCPVGIHLLAATGPLPASKEQAAGTAE